MVSFDRPYTYGGVTRESRDTIQQLAFMVGRICPNGRSRTHRAVPKFVGPDLRFHRPPNL